MQNLFYYKPAIFQIAMIFKTVNITGLFQDDFFGSEVSKERNTNS